MTTVKNGNIPPQLEERSVIMLDSGEPSEVAEKAEVSSESPKEKLVEHPEVLEVAEELKKRKFTWSGLVLMGIGLLVIALGLLLNTGVYSVESLIVGVGVIVVIIGILRILIGLINPIFPGQLR
jgi:hypothetical protein